MASAAAGSDVVKVDPLALASPERASEVPFLQLQEFRQVVDRVGAGKSPLHQQPAEIAVAAADFEDRVVSVELMAGGILEAEHRIGMVDDVAVGSQHRIEIGAADARVLDQVADERPVRKALQVLQFVRRRQVEHGADDQRPVQKALAVAREQLPQCFSLIRPELHFHEGCF